MNNVKPLHKNPAVNLAVLFILVSAVLSWVFWTQAKGHLQRATRERLRDIVALASLQIDAEAHRSLAQSGNEASPAYLRLKHTLQQIHDATDDISCLYTLRQGHTGTLEYVIDAEAMPERAAHVGDTYNAAGPLTGAKFSTMQRPFVAADFFTDQRETLLVGYAPLYTAAGQRAGVVGAAIDIGKVRVRERRLLVMALLIFAGSVPLALLLAWLAARRLAAPAAGHGDHEGQAQFQLALEAARAGTWNWNINTGEVFLDARSQTLFGLEPGTFDGTYYAWKKLVTAEDVVEAEKKVFAAIDGGHVNLEFRVNTKEGLRVINAQGQVIKDGQGEPRNLIGIHMDITERKKAEQELGRTKYFLENIIESSLDCIIITNEMGNITQVNKAFCDLSGFHKEEIIGKHSTELSPNKPGRYTMKDGSSINIDKTFLADSTQMLSQFMGQEKVSNWERYLLCRDGRVVPAEINLFLMRDEDGELLGGVGISRDITERKRAERALRESNEFLENIFRASADAILITGKRGIITMSNEAAEKMLGYSKEELAGKIITELEPPDEANRKRGLEFITTLFNEGTVNNFERAYQAKDGSLVEVETSAALLQDAAGNPTGAIAILRDVTERKRLETQLQRAEKMETIGVLAGGVAHDLNNVLGAIVGYPDLLLGEVPDDSPLRRGLEAIRESGTRAAAIVQDLLTLTRRGITTTEVVNLNSIVQQFFETRELAQIHTHHPRVDISMDLQDDLLNIVGSPVHLSKTVINIVSNAAETMPEGGRIVISTENRYLDQTFKGYDSVEEGDYAVLAVSDEGIGISDEDLQKIFEPFYTKKAMGRSGTGLGMAVVWGTVQDHHGYIDVKSTQGQGTVFRIYFPATRRQVPETQDNLSAEEYQGNGEKILIVDDVEAQRELAATILTRLNYAVTTVASGEEAIAFMQTGSADLILLDMIMDPGIDGLETYRKILESNPQQKAVIASGFSETNRVKETLNLGAGAYLKKPYTVESLGVTVKAALQPKH